MIGILSTVFLTAVTIALVPHYLRILPRHGGLAQRLGIAIAPTLVAAMAASYVSAIAYDVVFHDYRAIWAITGVLALAGGLVMQWLRLPPGTERAHPNELWRPLRDILWGRRHDRRLFRGELQSSDADGAALLERLQDELDPYKTRSDPA